MDNSWLGRWFLVQTLDEDGKKIELDIREIRQLLDDDAEGSK